MIIPVPVGVQYFIVPGNASEKEIKQEILKKRKLMYVIVSAALALVGVALWTLTKTSLSDLYESNSLSLPFTYDFAPIASILLGITLFFLLQRRNDDDVDYVSTETHNGKLKITPVANTKNELYIMVVIMVLVAMIVAMFVWPILSLTSSIYDSVPR